MLTGPAAAAASARAATSVTHDAPSTYSVHGCGDIAGAHAYTELLPHWPHVASPLQSMLMKIRGQSGKNMSWYLHLAKQTNCLIRRLQMAGKRPSMCCCCCCCCDVHYCAPWPTLVRHARRYDILYGQNVSTEDMYLGMSDRDPSSVHANTMVLVIDLPGEDLSALDLDVKARSVELLGKHHRLQAYLPRPVIPEKGKAQWDKAKHQLRVTLVLKEEAPWEALAR